jgi:FtsP/CotA-like multicopper oxidase with cupredoxin domain
MQHRGPSSISRRQILGWTAFGAATATPGLLGLAIAAGDTAEHGHGPKPLGVPGAPRDREAALVEPEIRRAVDGELRTSLRVGYAYKDIGGYRLSLRSYEGGLPAPTLRARPGDTLRIRLVNALPPNPDAMPLDMALPHHFNSTNFHFHGGHVSPDGISDNVFRVMEPGQSCDVEIKIPEDHTRGTYWYHPHKHGSADIQISSGMAGALIIEGDFDDLPEVAAAAERVLILNEVLFDYRGTIETYDTVWPEAVPRFLSVNGQREPVIRMRPGEVQRWRVIHAGHEDYLAVALERHALHAIAFDGIRRARIDRSDSVLMAPGQRADLLVRAGPPGTYALRAIANDQGYPSPAGPLARLVVEGEPMPMRLPSSLGGSPFADISDAEVTNRRRITLSTIEPESPASANYQEFAFLMCGRRFDPARIDHRIPLGAVEEWTVVNEDAADHVFHIHTNPFQMISVNGGPLDERVWRDTVVVPRKGEIVFRSRFLDFTGKLVTHCHMMNHEELGMMQVIEIFRA